MKTTKLQRITGDNERVIPAGRKLKIVPFTARVLWFDPTPDEPYLEPRWSEDVFESLAAMMTDTTGGEFLFTQLLHDLIHEGGYPMGWSVKRATSRKDNAYVREYEHVIYYHNRNHDLESWLKPIIYERYNHTLMWDRITFVNIGPDVPALP